MRVLNLSDLPAGLGVTAVTIGKFDGVHLGHRELLDTVVASAAERGSSAVAITFDRNPRAVLDPSAALKDLVSLEQKLGLLGGSGLDATLVLQFDGDLASLSPAAFVAQVLVEGLSAAVVVVGDDFRFGARGAGDVALLRRLGAESGFEVLVPPVVLGADGQRVSSTAIRERLAGGDIRGAAAMLGRGPTIRAEVVHGAHRGRSLGYPTANLSRDVQGLVPADGVYAAWLTVDGQRYGAAVSVGNNPTFEGVPDQQVEAHALDQELDLYGKVVDIEFVEFIRGMRKFPDGEALATQMAADEDRIRFVLSVPRP